MHSIFYQNVNLFSASLLYDPTLNSTNAALGKESINSKVLPCLITQKTCSSTSISHRADSSLHTKKLHGIEKLQMSICFHFYAISKLRCIYNILSTCRASKCMISCCFFTKLLRFCVFGSCIFSWGWSQGWQNGRYEKLVSLFVVGTHRTLS